MAPLSITVRPLAAARRADVGQRRITVVLADDHPLFREALERAVRQRPELEFVGAAGDGREALAAIRELAPDVAVLDLRMPELDGLQILNAATRDRLPTRVLVLSASGDSELVYRALQGGAAGYFLKEADRDAILDAISAVARGGTAIDPELQASVFDQVRLRGAGEERPILTAREREVLGLMATAYRGRRSRSG